jgi:hypothetical protein
MTPTNETRLKDLEDRKANLTPDEEQVRVALLELDEKAEDVDDAQKALAEAITSNPTLPVPDPIIKAQKDVVDATALEVTAQTAYDSAEATLAANALVVIAPVVTTPEGNVALTSLKAATK